MKRLVAWVAGAAGGLAAYRALRRPKAVASEPAGAPDPRAEELRARLEQTKETEEVAVEPDADARRRAVHDEARAAIDEMRDGSEAS